MHRKRQSGGKDVVRKKLGLATSVPIYFSLRSVDLEDGTFATEMDPLLNFFFLHR